MTRRSFRSELASLIFALRASSRITNDPSGRRILDDFDLALRYYRIERVKRYLVWGLLIGRSVDHFTSFFLLAKGASLLGARNTFNNRISRICSSRNPLTSNPTIGTDLDTVRQLRNDLFHNAGRHFTDTEMRTLVFDAVKCILQLNLDL